MVERLTALDASFLHLQGRDIPEHVGGVLVLEAPKDGLAAVESLVHGPADVGPSDRHRPLWELYLVEELAGDRGAVVTKTHPDGRRAQRHRHRPGAARRG